MNSPFDFRYRSRAVWGMVTVLVVGLPLVGISLRAIAQDSHFGSLTLSRGATVQQNGHTGGGTSLPTTVRDRDNAGNLCLGFGTSTPDFVLEVTETLPSVSLRVNSGGNDTTLVVDGPGGVHCGDDTGSNKDASIQGTNWRSGRYRVWVGAIASGRRYNYTFTAVGR